MVMSWTYLYVSGYSVNVPTVLQRLAFDLHIAVSGPSLQSWLYTLFLICISGCSFARLLSRKKDSVPKARTILHALQTVLTPTQSIWPSSYAALAVRAADRGNSDETTIRLDLGTVYDDLLYSKVELRDSSSHLPLLLKDALPTFSGVSFRLDVGLHWWLKLLGWTVFCEFIFDHDLACIVASAASTKDAPIAIASNGKCSPPPPHGTINLCTPPCSLFLRVLHDGIPAIALDCVPRRHLKSRIRKLQAVMLPGTFFMLGLTARAGAETQSFWSKSTILTALPFLSRTTSSQTSQPPIKRIRRTTTPLFTSVATVVHLLTSGQIPLVVEVVRNVSTEYAAFLHRNLKDLEDHPDVRAAFVAQWGMREWTNERLCTAWEAGLVDAGMLENWAIVVRKPERRLMGTRNESQVYDRSTLNR